MTFKDFESLTLEEKGDLVFNKVGSFLAVRKYYNQKLLLYDMGDYFAQVWFQPNSDKINKIDFIDQNDPVVDLYY